MFGFDIFNATVLELALIFLAVLLIGWRLARWFGRLIGPTRRWRRDDAGFRGNRFRPHVVPKTEPVGTNRYLDRALYQEKTANQMQTVSRARFNRRRLMNKEEYRLYVRLEELIRPTRHLLFAQVSCGEFLSCGDETAFALINSKRVDFLIVDPAGFPVVAVEYQGLGHWESETAAARDAIKRVAFRSAGIDLIEAYPDDAEIEIRVRRALGLPDPTETSRTNQAFVQEGGADQKEDQTDAASKSNLAD